MEEINVGTLSGPNIPGVISAAESLNESKLSPVSIPGVVGGNGDNLPADNQEALSSLLMLSKANTAAPETAGDAVVNNSIPLGSANRTTIPTTVGTTDMPTAVPDVGSTGITPSSLKELRIDAHSSGTSFETKANTMMSPSPPSITAASTAACGTTYEIGHDPTAVSFFDANRTIGDPGVVNSGGGNIAALTSTTTMSHAGTGIDLTTVDTTGLTIGTSGTNSSSPLTFLHDASASSRISSTTDHYDHSKDNNNGSSNSISNDNNNNNNNNSSSSSIIANVDNSTAATYSHSEVGAAWNNPSITTVTTAAISATTASAPPAAAATGTGMSTNRSMTTSFAGGVRDTTTTASSPDALMMMSFLDSNTNHKMTQQENNTTSNNDRGYNPAMGDSIVDSSSSGGGGGGGGDIKSSSSSGSMDRVSGAGGMVKEDIRNTTNVANQLLDSTVEAVPTTAMTATTTTTGTLPPHTSNVTAMPAAVGHNPSLNHATSNPAPETLVATSAVASGGDGDATYHSGGSSIGVKRTASGAVTGSSTADAYASTITSTNTYTNTNHNSSREASNTASLPIATTSSVVNNSTNNNNNNNNSGREPTFAANATTTMTTATAANTTATVTTTTTTTTTTVISSSQPLSRSVKIEDLRKYFHFPIVEVAKQLGTCTTALKKICRKNKINKWPYRQIRSITKSIQSLEMASLNDTLSEDLRIQYRQQIVTLQNAIDSLIEDPNRDVQLVNMGLSEEALLNLKESNAAALAAGMLRHADGTVLSAADLPTSIGTSSSSGGGGGGGFSSNNSNKDALSVGGSGYSNSTNLQQGPAGENHAVAVASAAGTSWTDMSASAGASAAGNANSNNGSSGSMIGMVGPTISGNVNNASSSGNAPHNSSSSSSSSSATNGGASGVLNLLQWPKPSPDVQHIMQAASQLTSDMYQRPVAYRGKNQAKKRRIAEEAALAKEEAAEIAAEERAAAAAILSASTSTTTIAGNNNVATAAASSAAAVGVGNTGTQMGASGQNSSAVGHLSNSMGTAAVGAPVGGDASATASTGTHGLTAAGHRVGPTATGTAPSAKDSAAASGGPTTTGSVPIHLLEGGNLRHKNVTIGETIANSAFNAESQKVVFSGPVHLAALQRKKLRPNITRKVVPLMEPDIGSNFGIEFIPQFILGIIHDTIGKSPVNSSSAPHGLQAPTAIVAAVADAQAQGQAQQQTQAQQQMQAPHHVQNGQLAQQQKAPDYIHSEAAANNTLVAKDSSKNDNNCDTMQQQQQQQQQYSLPSTMSQPQQLQISQPPSQQEVQSVQPQTFGPAASTTNAAGPSNSCDSSAQQIAAPTAGVVEAGEGIAATGSTPGSRATGGLDDDARSEGGASSIISVGVNTTATAPAVNAADSNGSVGSATIAGSGAATVGGDSVFSVGTGITISTLTASTNDNTSTAAVAATEAATAPSGTGTTALTTASTANQ